MEAINKLKVEAFRNAIKLFRDACILARSGSNESAFALGVLAYEELGKCALADRQLDRVCLNPGSEDWARKDLAKLVNRHKTKQGWASFDTAGQDAAKWSDLDKQKQSALYVEYAVDKVIVPSVSDDQLKDLLKEVFRALNDIGDVPYFGVEGFSTNKSEWQAKKDIESIKGIYAEVSGL